MRNNRIMFRQELCPPSASQGEEISFRLASWISYFSFIRCVCIRARTYMCLWVCVHMLCRHVCMCVNLNMKARRQSSPYVYIWDRTSHWTWSSLIRLDWLSSKPQGSVCLCLPRAGAASVPLWPVFMWVLKIKLRSLCSPGKHFTDWFTSSALMFLAAMAIYVTKAM